MILLHAAPIDWKQLAGPNASVPGLVAALERAPAKSARAAGHRARRAAALYLSGVWGRVGADEWPIGPSLAFRQA